MFASRNILYSVFCLLTFLASPSSFANSLEDSLVVHYPFNEGVGPEALDAANHNSSGVLQNGVTWAPGRHGNALQFGLQADGHVILPNPCSRLNPEYITASAWVNPDVVGNKNYYIVSKGRDCCDNPGQGGYNLWVGSNGRLKASIWLASTQTSVSVQSDTPIEAGEWAHAAFTFNGVQLALYINGANVGSVAVAVDVIQPSDKPLTIGVLSHASYNYYGFDGLIDDVRVYNKALTEAELQTVIGEADVDPGASTFGDDQTELFYQSFDDQQSIDDAGGTGSDYALVPGFVGNGIQLDSGASLTFDSVGKINRHSGEINFKFKPEWDGSALSATQYLFTARGRVSDNRTVDLRIFIYKGGDKSYFVLRFDNLFNCDPANQIVPTCQREVSTSALEPEVVMSWEANDWHDIRVVWNNGNANPQLLFVIDGQTIKFNHKAVDLCDFAFESIHIGSSAANTQPAAGVIDELYIYDKSIIATQRSAEIYSKYTRDNNIQEAHETIHNSPDAQLLDASIAEGENVFFFKKKPFEAVYEGSLPEQADVANALTFSILRNQYETLFFNVYSRLDITEANVQISDLDGPGAVINSSDIQLKVVHNWFQSGRFSAFRDVLAIYVPELLLDDDRIDFTEQEWAHNNLPQFATHEGAWTSMQSNTAKQFAIIVHVPEGQVPGAYSGTVTFTTDTNVVKTLSVNIEVLTPVLPDIDKYVGIYHESIIDETLASNRSVTLDRFRKQLADIKAHGFNSIGVYSADPTYIDEVFAAGLDQLVGIVSFQGADLANGISALLPKYDEYDLEPLIFGRDEPYLDDRIISHINKSAVIDSMGASVITAINIDSANELRDCGGRVYLLPGITEPNNCQPLDYENLNPGYPVTAAYFTDIVNAPSLKPTDREQSYYWQLVQEYPGVSRFHAGFYFWLNKMDGVFPYVYNKVRANPYDDFDAEINSTERDLHIAYPSDDGPVPTIQWEALREGLDDYRHLMAWQALEQYVDILDGQTTSSVAPQSRAMIDGILDKYKDIQNHKTLPMSEYATDRETLITEIISLEAHIQAEDPDRDQQANLVDLDDDNDGMSDVWELQFGLDPLDDADSRVDADSDGFSNLEEFEAGSDPTDQNSMPGIDVPMMPAFALVCSMAVIFFSYVLSGRRRELNVETQTE
jgi:hypothetical protein